MNIKKIIAFVFLSIFIIGCGEKKEEHLEEKFPKVVKIYNLEEAGSYKISFEYPAQIEAFQDSTLAFELSGKIVEFNYKEGQKVKKGSLIAKLDDEIYIADYNRAKANYTQALHDYKRYKKLFSSRSVAKVELEKQKQNLDINKAAFQIAKKNLEETKLIAEFDGVLAKKLIDDYERVTAKQPIARLQDNSFYKVNFFVPETDILKLDGKLTLEFISTVVDFYVYLLNIDKKIDAKLIDISTTAEEVTRTYEASLQITPPKNLTILPGMTAKVRVIAKNKGKNSMYIPYKAIFTDDSNFSYVWKIDKNNRVQKVKVELGKLHDDSVEILNGLENVSKIVLSGIRFLNENDEVKEYEKVGE